MDKPVTVLRPRAVHRPRSRHAQEWWFFMRVLNGCRRIPLAHGGRSRFRTTSTRTVADAPDEAALVGLPDARHPPEAGVTPWSTTRPFVCTSFLRPA